MRWEEDAPLHRAPKGRSAPRPGQRSLPSDSAVMKRSGFAVSSKIRVNGLERMEVL